MKSVLYKFNDIKMLKQKSYINQYIIGRKLSDIYHSHDFYEFVIIAQGSCTQMINGETYALNKDSLVLLCPNAAHSTLSQSEDICLISISVKAEEFVSFANAFDIDLSEKLKSENVLFCEVANIYRNISLVCTDDIENCSEYESKLLLAYLLKIVVGKLEKKLLNMPKNVHYALQQIRNPEHLKGGVEALVKLSGYSRSQLSRIISKSLNTTLHNYILDLKLDTAYSDIILSSESLEDISEKLGYASFSHFNKIFKAKFGITPAVLRKNHKLWTV